MITIHLKGREIPLLYTVMEMKTIQEDICPLGDLSYRILGVNRDDPEDRNGFGGPEHLDAVAKLIRILGNAGLEEAGENPDLTEKKILRALKPTEISGMVNACAEALNEGLTSEIPPQDDGEPKDVVLEDMKKKEIREG